MNMHVPLCLGILSCLVIHGQASEIGPLLPSNNRPPPEEKYVDPDYASLEPFETAFHGANVIPQRPELLKHYESMLEQFPDHPRRPEVMVQLALVSGSYNPTTGEKRHTAAMLSWYARAMEIVKPGDLIWTRAALQTAITSRETKDVAESPDTLAKLREFAPGNQFVWDEFIRTELAAGNLQPALAYYQVLHRRYKIVVLFIGGERAIAKFVYRSKTLTPEGKIRTLQSLIPDRPTTDASLHELVSEYLAKLEARSKLAAGSSVEMTKSSESRSPTQLQVNQTGTTQIVFLFLRNAMMAVVVVLGAFLRQQ